MSARDTTRPARLVLAAAMVVVAVLLASSWKGETKLADAERALADGRAPEAIRLSSEVSGRSVSGRAALVAARAALRLGDLRAAAREMARAAELTPSEWGIHYDHALILERLGRRREAAAALRRAIALNPLVEPPAGFTDERR